MESASAVAGEKAVFGVNLQDLGVFVRLKRGTAGCLLTPARYLPAKEPGRPSITGPFGRRRTNIRTIMGI